MLIVLFLVSHFNFLFVLCGGLSWLPVSFLLHVKHTLSYRIVEIEKFSIGAGTTAVLMPYIHKKLTVLQFRWLFSAR